MELVIIAVLAVWLVLAVRSMKKGRGCCGGKCSGCSQSYKDCRDCKKGFNIQKGQD